MIRSLELDNFKCFLKQRFDVAPLTLLAGLNGMGKSTVIQSLLVLRQSFSERPSSAMGSIALNGDLVEIGTFKDLLCEDAKEDEDVVRIAIGNELGRTLFEIAGEFGDLKQPANALDNIFSESLFKDTFRYLCADRHGPGVFFRSSIQDVVRHQQIGIRGEFAPHYLAAFGTSQNVLEGMQLTSASSASLISQVEAWLDGVSPGIQIHVSEQSAALGLDLVTLRYSYALKKHVSNQFRSTNVGFGVTYSLPIFVAILSSKPGDLVLIENPEAHLHPHGQYLIGRLLAMAAKCGVQILAETHSDHVLNGVRIAMREKILEEGLAKIFFFTREEQNTVHPTVHELVPDAEGKIGTWPSGFFDEWDKALEKLF